MWKRILLSLGVIGVVGGAAVMGTQALLSDAVTLTANTFSTGSVDLQIWSGSSYVETTTGFSGTMLPGQSSGPHVIWLKNNNSGTDLAITAAATVTDPGSGDMDPTNVMVTLTPMTVDGTSIAPGGSASTQSLAAWQSTTALGVPNIPSGGEQRYHMTVSVNSGVTTSNESVMFNFTFTGTQTP